MISHSAAKDRTRINNSRRSAREALRLVPLASALSLLFISAPNVYAASPGGAAWFAASGAGKSARANGPRPQVGLPPSVRQQQAARQQLQRSVDNLGRTANAIAAAQAAQRAAREAAQGIVPSDVADGHTPGGLWDKDAGGNDLAWTGAKRPVANQHDGKHTVSIEQTASRAVLNWNTFNVGRNTTVEFQQNSGDAVLNRVVGADTRPSQIQGAIKGDGTVMVVNQNGVVFSGSSQVNVRNLVAAAVGMTDEQFAKGIYSDTNGSTGSRTYMPSFGNNITSGGASDKATGDVTVEAGAQIATQTPNSATRGGGYVLMLGREVHNAGIIETPSGQALLAAGDSFVIRRGRGSDENQQSTTRGNEVAARINTDSLAGAVSNSGLLLARTGDVTLTGQRITQQGVAVATSDVNARGSIHLLNSASDTNGSVTLSANSTTAVLIDENAASAYDSQYDELSENTANLNGPETALGRAFDNIGRMGDQPNLSRIEIVTGGTVDFQGDSMTLATGGQIAVHAGQRSLVRDGADLDVSGAVGVRVAMESNNIQVNVQGNEQRDAPVNRDSGSLNNSDIWVDRRTLVFVPAGTNGYETDRWYTAGGLLEVSGYVGTTGHSVGEWLASGGTVNFTGQDVVTQTGSRINLSGGTMDVQDGYIRQTWVRAANGRLYEVSRAPGDILYTGLYNGYEVTSARWGESATRRFYNPLIAPNRRFESGYTVGRDAGRLVIGTASAVLEGSLISDTFQGDRQVNAPQAGLDGYSQSQTAVARRAQLILGQYNPNRIPGTALGVDFTPVTNHVAIQGDVEALADSLTLAAPLPEERSGTILLDSEAVSNMQLGGILIGAKETIRIDHSLETDLGGEIALRAPQVDVNADLVARSGSIQLGNYVTEANSVLPSDPATVVGVNLAPGATLDVRGTWSNLFLDPTDRRGLPFVDGGSVSIRSTGPVTLGEGSVIDVSSGAALTSEGNIVGGRGGNVTLLSRETLTLGGDLRGYGINGSGTLQIEAGTPVSIGGELLAEDGILQVGEVALTDMKVLEDFIIPAGEILPADYSFTKTHAMPGETVDGRWNLSPGNGITLDVNWTPPPALPGTGYRVVLDDGTRVLIRIGSTPVIPAGSTIVGIDNPANFPPNYIVPGDAFPNGIPIAPTTTVLKAGAIATEDSHFAAGTVIQAGARLSHSVAVQAALVLDTDLFQRGFSQYIISGERGVAVASNATVHVAAPVLHRAAIASEVPTGAHPDHALAEWLPPVFLEDPTASLLSQRGGASLALRSLNGNILVGEGSTIEVDPYQDISLSAAKNIDINGTLRALGGSIEARPSTAAPDPITTPWPVAPARSIRVSAGAVLDVTGHATTAVDATGSIYGDLSSGGKIVLEGGIGTFVIVEAGATLDASGSSMAITVPAGRNVGATGRTATVASDGGTISLSSNAGLYLNGTIRAAAGGEGAAGGTLALTLEAPLYRIEDNVSDALRQPAELTVVQQALQDGNSARPLADTELSYGYARIGVDQVQAGGFDNLSLFARDLITFDGDIDLSLGQSIRLYQGTIGNTVERANVRLHAPHILLSGRTTLATNAAAGSINATLNTWRSSRQAAAGTFAVDADLIDIQNVVRFGISSTISLNAGSETIDRRGFQDVVLSSRGDIRFLQASEQVNSSVNPIANQRHSALISPSDIALQAARIYPVSHALGAVAAGITATNTYDSERVLRISRTEIVESAPLSVFGELELHAATIEQGGALYAPLGRIALGNSQATRTIQLLPGSLTSVSAAGLIIPYGGTVDDLSYTYNGEPIDAVGVGGTGAVTGDTTTSGLRQGISLVGTSVMADDGAIVDLSGGGELTGAAFISGRGGSTDPLFNALVKYDGATGKFSLPALSDHPVYAIVPSYEGAYAPVTPVDQNPDYAGSLPRVGEQITIGSGIPGLPAGTYTLLPAYYALLPGAYRVELGNTTKSAAPPIALRNGSWALSGTKGIANSSIAEVLPRQITITSGEVLRQYAQYNETSYREFILADTARTGTPRPMLPDDAKALEFRFRTGAGQEMPALDFSGSVRFDRPETGYGGQVIVGAASGAAALEIVDQHATAGFSGISVRAEDLNALGADRISIGGWMTGYGYSSGDSGVSVDTRLRPMSQTGNITVRSGTALAAPEVMLITGGSRNIHVEDGASINTLDHGAAPYDSSYGYQYNPDVTGAANILMVSNGWLDLPLGGGSGTGRIEVGGCTSTGCTGSAQLYSDGSIVFASNNVVIDEATRFGTRNLTMAVSGLNLGSENSLADALARGALPEGLRLSQGLLTRLLNGDPEMRAPALERLIFSVRDSVNLFGTVDLSTLDPETGKSSLGQLVFNTPAIYGYGTNEDVATISTDTLVWNGVAGRSAGPVLEDGPGTGAGTLDVQARQIIFGYAEGVTPSPHQNMERLALGFSTVNLQATDRITANGEGDLSVYRAEDGEIDGVQQYTGGNLNLITPLLTGEAGSINRLKAGDALTLNVPEGASAGSHDALGATLELSGASVTLDGTIALASGKLDVIADGNVQLNANTHLDLAGREIQIQDERRYSWGGEVNLESSSGNISQLAGSTIDLSAQNNQAGRLTATALGEDAGRIALAGTILGTATGDYDAGGSQVDYEAGGIVLAGRAIDDFAGLNRRLTDGGVVGLRSFRIKEGDLTIGDEIQAHRVMVAVDGGSLTIDGRIDASGRHVGEIRLAARDNLTLTSNAQLDAHGRELRVDSYGYIIDAPNRAIVDLTSGTDGTGTLTIQQGAIIDLRAGTDIPAGSGPGQHDGRNRSTLALNVPRMGNNGDSATGSDGPGNATGGDLDINVPAPVDVRGAASVAVYGYASYDNAPADPENSNGQVVDQDYLDSIHRDSQAFIRAAYGGDVAAGTLTAGLQSKLAGLTVYGNALHLRPGVEINSATETGDIRVEKDLDLSGYRYGPNVTGVRGSGEPGALSLRAGGDLDIEGSINDGFAPPPATPEDDRGWARENILLTGGVPASADITFDAPYYVSPDGWEGYYYVFPGNDVWDYAVVTQGRVIEEASWGTNVYGPGDTIWGMLEGRITIEAGTILTANDPSNANIVFTEGDTGRQLWAVAPMLAAGSLSWDIRLGAGADLSSADRRALQTAAQLAGKGNITLSDAHYIAGTQNPIFSVIRTGTGDLDIQAGGSFSQDSLYGIYTAGTQSAPLLDKEGAPIADMQGRDAFNLPRGYNPDISSTSILSASHADWEGLVTGSNYSAWYPEQGGNLSVNVQGDMTGDIVSGGITTAPVNTVSSNYVASWLWRQGGNNVSQHTAWWINFGTYVSSQDFNGVPALNVEGFTGLGTLGGGNVDLRVKGDAGNITSLSSSGTRESDGLVVAVGSTGRLVDGKLTLTGGGDLRLAVGGSLNEGVRASGTEPGRLNYSSIPSDLNGVFTNLRGSLALQAGAIGRVDPLYGVVDVTDARAVDPLYPSLGRPSGGPVVMLGDATTSLLSRGDLVIDGVGDPGRLSQSNYLPFESYAGGGISWYSLWTSTTAVSLFAAGGNLTPVTMQHYAPGAGTVVGNTTLLEMNYPSRFDAVAAQGNIYYARNGTVSGGTGANRLIFAPNAQGVGWMNLLAGGSIYGGGFGLDPSGAASTAIPTPFRPAFIGRSPDGFSDLVDNTQTGARNDLFAFGANTASGSLYGNDPTPVRVYADSGDIVGVSVGSFWQSADELLYMIGKPVRMRAGRDIINAGGVFLNYHSTDISMISAGRDIQYANARIAGPGLLEVSAGRHLYQGDTAQLESLGLINGGENRTGGAGIAVSVGLGDHPVDYTGFALHYLDGANLADPDIALARQPGKVVMTYGSELTLADWLRENFGYTGDEAGAQTFLDQRQAELNAAYAANPNDPAFARRDLTNEYQQTSQLRLVNWLSTRFATNTGVRATDDGAPLVFEAVSLPGADTDPAIAQEQARQREAQAQAFFRRLPAEQQRVYARNLYYAELNAGGREYNDASSPRTGSYLRGRAAIAMLFPTYDTGTDIQARIQSSLAADIAISEEAVRLGVAAADLSATQKAAVIANLRDSEDQRYAEMYAPIDRGGNLTLFQGTTTNGAIRTLGGGDIQVLAPAGGTTIGVESVPPATANGVPPAGLITQGSGNIQVYSSDSILLGLSRIMTTYGGDILAWSQYGNINAGRGAKSTVVYTPLLRAYDGMGNVSQSPSVPATGAGVSTQDPVPEVPPGGINLIAPEGIIDASEAGIRSSGSVNVAALQVVNAANIQAKGEATGVPVIAAVNVGALTSASAAASSAATAAQDVMRQSQAAARQNLPSIISVQILGFGDDGAVPAASPPDTSRSGPRVQGLGQQVAYDPNKTIQVVANGPLNPGDRAQLTAQESFNAQ